MFSSLVIISPELMYARLAAMTSSTCCTCNLMPSYQSTECVRDFNPKYKFFVADCYSPKCPECLDINRNFPVATKPPSDFTQHVICSFDPQPFIFSEVVQPVVLAILSLLVICDKCDDHREYFIDLGG